MKWSEELAIVKSDQIKIEFFNELSESDFYMNHLTMNPLLIAIKRNPSESLLKKVIKMHSDVIKIIDKKYITDNLILLSLDKNIKLIKHFPDAYKLLRNANNSNNTNKIIDSLEKNPKIIQFIENPSMKEMMTAVGKRPTSIKYIKNPPSAICKLSLSKAPLVIRYIKNPTDEMIKQSLLLDYNALKYIEQTEEICLYTLKNHWHKEALNLIELESVFRHKEYKRLLLFNGSMK